MSTNARNRMLMGAAAIAAVVLYMSIYSKGTKSSCGCGKK